MFHVVAAAPAAVPTISMMRRPLPLGKDAVRPTVIPFMATILAQLEGMNGLASTNPCLDATHDDVASKACANTKAANRFTT